MRHDAHVDHRADRADRAHHARRWARLAARAVAFAVAVATTAAGCTAAPGVTGYTAAASLPRSAPVLADATLVIGHRGASGYRPEHTLAAYDLAIDQGADAIEPDLVMTRDNVLVVRHEPEIGATTDVADHPEFADRRTSKTLDGKTVTGWWVEDFTLVELKSLRVRERLPDLRPGNAELDGQEQIATFDEVLDLRERRSAQAQRRIAVVPEIKHPARAHELGQDPEAALVRALQAHDLDHTDAPVWIQSFELPALSRLRHQLNYAGHLILLTTDAAATTPQALAEVKKTVDGIGPTKSLVFEPDDAGPLTPTTLVHDAHTAGLAVFVWTFRAENEFLPAALRSGEDPSAVGRMADEVSAYLRLGVDGVFCDQPDVCVRARAAAQDAR